jgi:hypothetical protein
VPGPPVPGDLFGALMVADWFETMVGRKGFSVRVHPVGREEFEVSSDDARTMISLLLQRQRHKSGLSLAQAVAPDRGIVVRQSDASQA